MIEIVREEPDGVTFYARMRKSGIEFEDAQRIVQSRPLDARHTVCRAVLLFQNRLTILRRINNRCQGGALQSQLVIANTAKPADQSK